MNASSSKQQANDLSVKKSPVQVRRSQRKKRLTSKVCLEFTRELKEKIIIDGKEAEIVIEKAKCNYHKFEADANSSKGTTH